MHAEKEQVDEREGGRVGPQERVLKEEEREK